MSTKFQATLCKHKFEIQINDQWESIEHLITFDPDFSGNMETWNPMELSGFSTSERTAVDAKISAEAYRTYGATANDAIAECVMGILDDVKFPCRWTLPNQKAYAFTGVVNTTKITSGSTKDLDKMSFEVYIAGKPEATTATE